MSELKQGDVVEVIGNSRFQHGFSVGAVVTLMGEDQGDDSWEASGPLGDGDETLLKQWIGSEDVRAVAAVELCEHDFQPRWEEDSPENWTCAICLAPRSKS